MPQRHLKNEDGEFVLGVNGKKLRYLIDKENKKINAKFKENWTDDAIDILEIKYEEYTFEYEQNKRGRPGKKKPKSLKRLKESKKIKTIRSASTVDTSDDEEENMEVYFTPFNIGNRIKLITAPYSQGEIINFDNVEKMIIVKTKDGDIIKCRKNTIQKMRGRKPKRKIDYKDIIVSDSDDDEIEMLKHDGKMYIINKKNEVMDLNGNYIGEYIDGEIV